MGWAARWLDFSAGSEERRDDFESCLLRCLRGHRKSRRHWAGVMLQDKQPLEFTWCNHQLLSPKPPDLPLLCHLASSLRSWLRRFSSSLFKHAIYCTENSIVLALHLAWLGLMPFPPYGDVSFSVSTRERMQQGGDIILPSSSIALLKRSLRTCSAALWLTFLA